MNSENSKTSNPYWVMLHLTNKIDLKRSNKYTPYQILVSSINRKT